jgi:hypothetical protein
MLRFEHLAFGKVSVSALVKNESNTVPVHTGTSRTHYNFGVNIFPGSLHLYISHFKNDPFLKRNARIRKHNDIVCANSNGRA